jgi:hypothetical protein
MVATASTTFVLVYLGLSIAIGVMGLWLLWQDRHAARDVDQPPAPQPEVLE